tara:strand:- start:712 stop:1608 length:897 start_codon:yes stop_codon:yes gene_type:complete
MIKHLVISGGFYNGIKMYGALHELAKKDFYNINNIESIYCTSIGSLIGTLLSLKIDNDIIYDYIHKRPWYKISKIKNISFQKKGLLDKAFIEDIMKPVLQSKNLELNITLEYLYKYTNIDMHIFSTKLTDMSLVDISHKTHPKLSIIDAIYMSSAIPYFLEPYFYNNDFYIDGGVICNYPLDQCDKENDSIFGIRTNNVSNNLMNIGNDSTIIQYFLYLNLKLFKSISTKPTKKIKYNLILDVDGMNSTVFNDILHSCDKRLEFLQIGQKSATNFLQDIEVEREKESKIVKNTNEQEI